MFSLKLFVNLALCAAIICLVISGATLDLEEEYEQSQAELLAEFEKRKRVTA